MNHQQQIAVLLALYSVAFILWIVYNKKQNKRLSEVNSKLQIANEKLALYRHFINNTPVKKFFNILDSINKEVFDADIKAMLIKYFDKVFINLSIEHTANLITDIKRLKHSTAVMDAFIQANQRYGMDLIGLSLADAIQEGDSERLLIINEFVELLSPESKKAQITIAIRAMINYINNELIDLPSDYHEKAEQALNDLKKSIE